MIAVLTGGTGGAKFVDGLRRVVPPSELTIIVNTGDDFEWWGLHVSPDLDSITYVLANMLSKDRGWGVDGDTFQCLEAMRHLDQPAWFRIGDKDMATHLMRTRLLREGKTLSEATSEVAGKLGIESSVIPMTDSKVETRVTIAEGEISFQDYFVKRRFRDPVSTVRFAGAEDAMPAPGVIESIQGADAVLLAPSNPITSIGPILAIPGIREALRQTAAPVVAVSPMVDGEAFSGPAATLMSAQGLPVSSQGVAEAYADFLDVLLVDPRDSALPRPSNVRFHASNIVMKSVEERTDVARAALSALSEFRNSCHAVADLL